MEKGLNWFLGSANEITIMFLKTTSQQGRDSLVGKATGLI